MLNGAVKERCAECIANFLLTSWSRVLVRKLLVAQLVNNCIARRGTRPSITVFTQRRHFSMSFHSQ